MGMNVARRTIAMSFFLMLAMPVAQAQEYCAPVVASQLSKLGVDSERVEHIVYANSYSSGENARIVEIHAWIQLRSCNGYLVVEMTTGCRITQNYTRKECRVQGVHHSC